MASSRYFKEKDEVLTCPFCSKELTRSKHPWFKSQGYIGYNCFNCVVEGAKGAENQPYSRYMISILEELLPAGQLVAVETFLIHIKDDQYYNVHNNLPKQQTNIVAVEPAKKEHFLEGEEVTGMTHISEIAWFPLIDTWNPADQEATLSKIKTYLLFL